MDSKKSLTAYFKEMQRLSEQLSAKLSSVKKELEEPALSMKLIQEQV